MAWEQPGFNLTGFKAATNLSTSQFKFVTPSTDGTTVKLMTANTDPVIGLLYTNPTSGGEAKLGTFGVYKGRAGGAIDRGSYVGPSTTGWVVAKTMASTGGASIHGFALDTVSAANEIVTIYLNIIPGTVHTS
jgi:hypothetical protein